MIKLYDSGVYLIKGKQIIPDGDNSKAVIKKITGKETDKESASHETITYSILKKHNHSLNPKELQLKFDALTSHDITYVSIIQTARASGLEKFDIPYVLTNCHNSLCAVGGTINEDDHMFGLSAAKKYGGIYVPTHQAVIHQYMREMMSGCGKMILGSDSHTRYGALGTMAIGEGGGELVKQLLNRTYDINRPDVIAVYLTGSPQNGVGPQDIALAIIGAVFKNGYVKNKVMEFVGDGIQNLNVEYRNGIDVMTTETTCLSSIWTTDDEVKDYYDVHNRISEYKALTPGEVAYYDGMVYVDMSKIKPMIAMPCHPSNTYTIEELNDNLEDILYETEKAISELLNSSDMNYSLREKIKNNKLYVEQGVIAGCAGGTYDNICDAADILDQQSIGNDEFALSVYPSSQPTLSNLVENGTIAKLIKSGATIRTAFCGPCFGAGDVPSNNSLSIRHTTRNFPNREGSKPMDSQFASVALMDARSIAATAVNGGCLTPATDIDVNFTKPKYYFDEDIYKNRCYDGYKNENSSAELKIGPNIKDWPEISELTQNIVLKVVSVIKDSVTTTDELIPSGETSSYRSNPIKLAEYTLSRKDPSYVGKAKEIQRAEKHRAEGKCPMDAILELKEIFQKINSIKGYEEVAASDTGFGSAIYAIKPGDGSAREQAASCQRVLGGLANIAKEYATKRYRSNLINWGIIPFILKEEPEFRDGDYIFIPDIRGAISQGNEAIKAYIVGEEVKELELNITPITNEEKEIILSGCLMNYYKE